MTIRLLYHDPDSPGGVSPFDAAIVSIARADHVRLACPYISLAYLSRVTSLSASWRLLTDIEECLRSQNRTQRKKVHAFLVSNRSAVRHYPQLHAKVVIGSRAAMMGSAIFTDLGILRRAEVSAHLEDEPQVQELAAWFEAHWSKAYELPLDDIADFIKTLPEGPAVEGTSDPGLFPPVSTKPARFTELPGVPPDRRKGSWNGEFYCNFNDGENRSWADAVAYGFISAGGGAWYTRTLKLLNPGNRVWINAPGHGFVGVGRVMGRAEPVSTFKVSTPEGEVPVLDAAKGTHHKFEDPDRCEYFVPVQWLQTVPLEQAIKEIGLFGNRNTVCKPTTLKWRSTVERLKIKFPDFNK